MSSHKSTPAAPASASPQPTGVAPSRARGHLRVASILDTAGRLFIDQGYDAVTMTAIAARSGTAIGSLYRFFPTKEHVAEALLDRYGRDADAAFSALAARAATLTPTSLADALIDTTLSRQGEDHEIASALLFARPDQGEQRLRIRRLVYARLDQVLRANLAREIPPAFTGTVLQILKSLSAAGQYEALPGPAGPAIIAETRILLALYLQANARPKPGPDLGPDPA